jgi:xylose isomerase
MSEVFNNIKPVNFEKPYSRGKKPYRFIEKSKIAKGKPLLGNLGSAYGYLRQSERKKRVPATVLTIA